MNNKKTKKEYEIGRIPDSFYYGFLGAHILVPLICFFTRAKIKPDKEFLEAEGPIIVISTHASYLDPALSAKLTLGRKVNFVTGEFLFRNKFWGHAFKTGGAIPKKQFVTDAVSVKSMLKVLKRKGVLIIYPEATRSIDGTTVGFDDGVAKMAKKAGAAIYVEHIHGAYMSFPRWSKSGIRFGPISSEFVRKISIEEVAQLSAEELQAEVEKAMKYDENKWLAEQNKAGKNLKYGKKNLAVGLTNIAHACPKCGKEFVMKVADNKNMIECIACGNKAEYLPTGRIVPAGESDKAYSDLHEWTVWQNDLVKNQMENPDFSMEVDVKLFKVYDEVTFAHTGNGKVTITGTTIKYEGTDCAGLDGIPYKKGKPKKGFSEELLDKNSVFTEKEFHIASMRGLVASYGKYFEIYDGKGELFRFYTSEDEGNRVFKVHQIVQHANNRDN